MIKTTQYSIFQQKVCQGYYITCKKIYCSREQKNKKESQEMLRFQLSLSFVAKCGQKIQFFFNEDIFFFFCNVCLQRQVSFLVWPQGWEFEITTENTAILELMENSIFPQSLEVIFFIHLKINKSRNTQKSLELLVLKSLLILIRQHIC